MTDTRSCGQCAGTGVIDSGAPTQYGDFYEVTCPGCNGSGRVALRGPVRVDDPPQDETLVLVYCADGRYRTARHTHEGWFQGYEPWEMSGKQEPLYWWELPEVTHD